jgi:hypothetical protein
VLLIAGIRPLRPEPAWEALEAHFVTPHMNRFRSRVGGLGVREFTLQKYLLAPSAPAGRS